MDNPNFKAVLTAALLPLGIAGGLTGCNTIQGVGDDISSAGAWVGRQFDSSDHQNQSDLSPRSPTRAH